MTRTPILLSILFCVILWVSFTPGHEPSIEGIWDTGKDNTLIEIKKTNSKLEGKVYSSNNAEAPKGKLIIKDLVEKDNYLTGQVYIIKKDRWVNAQLQRNGNTLKVTLSNGWSKKELDWKLHK